MLLVFYISAHGFGHAARDVEVINAVARRAPDTRIVLRTAAPRWFLEASLEPPVAIVDGEVDTGVAQQDSLTIDVRATAVRAADFYAHFGSLVEREAALLRALGAALVVGDIPPLAFAAAHAAGVPSAAIGNFTWDWIYGGIPGFEAAAPGVAAIVANAYANATVALRLPFHGGFASFQRVDDVPLVARHATTSRGDVRQRLGLEDSVPLVLVSFGGHRQAIAFERAVSPQHFTLVATDYEAPAAAPLDGLRVVTAAELRAQQFSYTDLLNACDVVLTKLGYGIVSECIASDVALLYTPRGPFLEQDVFVRELPHVLRCRSIAQDELTASGLADASDAVLSQPAPHAAMPADGAETVAARLLAAASTRVTVP